MYSELPLVMILYHGNGKVTKAAKVQKHTVAVNSCKDVLVKI